MTILNSTSNKVVPADLINNKGNVEILAEHDMGASPNEDYIWLKVNDCLRGEIAAIKSALESTVRRARGLKEWEHLAAVQVVQLHAQHVMLHRNHLYNHVTPQLKKHFKFPEQLEASCDQILEKAEGLMEMVAKLVVGSKVHEFLHEWASYEAAVTSHLKKEEEVIMPKLRAHFKQQEIEDSERMFMRQATPLEIGSLIHFMGVAEFHQVLMKQKGVPLYTWYFDLRRKYAFFLNSFVCKIDILMCGAKPESWWNNLFLLEQVSATLDAFSPSLEGMI